MEGFGPASYGEGFADVYDDWYPDVTDAEACAAFVAAEARARAEQPLVVELGVGTGRLAEPLSALGLRVAGIDASTAMLARCRRRVPSAGLAAADMAWPPLRPATAAVVLIAFNTLFNLPDAASQRRCLVHSAQVLAPGGAVVIEAFVPGTGAAESSDRIDIARMDAHRLVLRVSRTDAASQTVVGQHVELVDGQPVRLRPWSLRFAAPEQIDALATSAGLRLVARWADWHRAPYTVDAPVHVSVYDRQTEG